MGLLDKLIGAYADDIMVKLMQYKDFPEEKYELAIENRQLKEKLYEFKDSHYNELVDENKKIKQEIEALRQEKINRLEMENKALRLELSNPNRTMNSYMLAYTEPNEINTYEIEEFMYIDGILKYYTSGNSYTVPVTEEEFKVIMNKLFPNCKINFDKEKIYFNLANQMGGIYANETRSLKKLIKVEEIDDWTERNKNLIISRNEVFRYGFEE